MRYANAPSELDRDRARMDLRRARPSPLRRPRAARRRRASASPWRGTERSAAARRARTRSPRPTRTRPRGSPRRRRGRCARSGRRGGATPKSPVAIPASAPSESRTPKTVRSSSAVKSGTLATSRAVSPEATRCSAHATAPVSTKSRSAPTIAAASHSRRPSFARGDIAAPQRPAVEDRARHAEAHREHEQRRQRPVGDGDREVRRSPDDVDGGECDGDLRAHGSTVPTHADQHKSRYRS